MLMAKLLQLLQRHNDVPFEVVDLVMDPGYNAVNRQKIESNAALLHIPVTIFETNIFDVTSGIEQSPCYLCARMRAAISTARRASSAATRSPLATTSATWSRRPSWACSTARSCRPCRRAAQPYFPGYGAHPPHVLHPRRTISSPGSAITVWSSSSAPAALLSTRPRTATTAAASKRQEVKLLLRELRRTNPDIEKSIFTAFTPSAPDTMVGLQSGGVEHTFADCYRERDGELAARTRNDAHRAYAPGGL